MNFPPQLKILFKKNKPGGSLLSVAESNCYVIQSLSFYERRSSFKRVQMYNIFLIPQHF